MYQIIWLFKYHCLNLLTHRTRHKAVHGMAELNNTRRPKQVKKTRQQQRQNWCEETGANTPKQNSKPKLLKQQRQTVKNPAKLAQTAASQRKVHAPIRDS